MVELIKENSKQYHYCISEHLSRYMSLENHFVLTKLSHVLKDDKVYTLELDTAISLNDVARKSIDASKFIDNFIDKEIYFWTCLTDKKIFDIFKINDKVKFVEKYMSDFSYLELEEDENVINVQQVFNKQYSFIEHLSTNKKWTRDFLGRKMTFPNLIHNPNDIQENKNSPDFVVKDVELDSGNGIYLFDKEDFDFEIFPQLYCEQFIDSDKHFNTFHLCGKYRSYDITNYKDFNFLNIPKYRVLESKQKIEYLIPERWDFDLSSRYQSLYHMSDEYR